jgi:hypothetical protein
MSTAVAQEVRILRKYNDDRVICIDPVLINSFVEMENQNGIHNYVAAFFVNHCLTCHQTGIVTCAVDEITRIMEFIFAKIQKGDILRTTAIRRRVQQLLGGTLTELSQIPWAIGVVLDQALSKEIYDVLRTSRRQRSPESIRTDALQVAEVFSVNAKQPADGPYVSLITYDERINLSMPGRTPLSRIMPIQHVYGPAWSASLGDYSMREHLGEIESFAVAGPWAKQLLEDLKEKKDTKASELTNEFIVARDAIKRFGEIMAPFHSAVINYVEKEVGYQMEYLDHLHEELPKGGETLEGIIKATISFLLKWNDKQTIEKNVI